MLRLEGKRVLLAVTGGIAAYKTCELLRLLKKAGADVQVLMTRKATEFVGPLTFEALSGKQVATDEAAKGSGIAHIALRENKDLILVAPATANIMAKIACGIADDLTSSVLLARKCPLMVAPAMNEQMWKNPATARNVRQLTGDGVLFSGPAAGAQACGDVGMGRMKEPAEIFEDVLSFFTPKSLKGKKILLTGGPTFEAIDPVRGITNASSGRQAYLLAREAARRGAQVSLISGPVSLENPADVKVIRVTSALEMHKAVFEELTRSSADCFIGVAAVGDWRPHRFSPSKLKKQVGCDTLEIRLDKNPDIVADVAASGLCPLVVGFAAETDHLFKNAQKKLADKKLDLIVGNGASAIGANENEAVLIDLRGPTQTGKMSKESLAEVILDKIQDLLASQKAL